MLRSLIIDNFQISFIINRIKLRVDLIGLFLFLIALRILMIKIDHLIEDFFRYVLILVAYS